MAADNRMHRDNIRKVQYMQYNIHSFGVLYMYFIDIISTGKFMKFVYS